MRSITEMFDEGELCRGRTVCIGEIPGELKSDAPIHRRIVRHHVRHRLGEKHMGSRQDVERLRNSRDLSPDL